MQHTSPLSLWLLAAALLTAAPASAAPGQTVIPAGSASSLPAGTDHFSRNDGGMGKHAHGD